MGGIEGGRGRTLEPDRVLIRWQATIFSSSAVVGGVEGKRCMSGQDFASAVAVVVAAVVAGVTGKRRHRHRSARHTVHVIALTLYSGAAQTAWIGF